MDEHPRVQYAKSGDIHIAYMSLGHGPEEILIAPGAVSHVEQRWNEPLQRVWFEDLAQAGRVTWFDKRGTGMSDRDARFTFEERIDDIRAVMDAQGIERAHLVGFSEGGPMCILFAATHPGRVQSLTLYASFPSWRRQIDYPAGNAMSLAEYSRYLDRIEAAFEGQPDALRAFVEQFAPSHLSNPTNLDVWRRSLQMAASPGAGRLIWELLYEIDVRHLLPALHLPTAIVHHTGDRVVPVEGGRYLAQNIPGARLIELPGDDHYPGPLSAVHDAVLENVRLAGLAGEPHVDRRLATVLFCDVVDSTKQAATAGDAAWRSTLDTLEDRVCDTVRTNRGVVVKYTGDGAMATFDGPSSAVRCGIELHSAVRDVDLAVRVGMHAGEIEVRGSDVAGLAVHLAARVASAAGPGETLVSSTVKDLVVGSGFRFENRGAHSLKGIPDEWQLFAARL